MKRLFIILLTFSFSAMAGVLTEVVVTGKVKSFDKKNVVLVDRYKQEHKVSRSQFSGVKLVAGIKLAFKTKIKSQKFGKSSIPLFFKPRLEELAGLRKKGKLKGLKLPPLLYKKKRALGITASYRSFLVDVEKHASYKLDTRSTFNRTIDEIIESVVSVFIGDKSVARDGDICFYGGYVSSIRNGQCTHPARASDGLYRECPTTGQFRCNPAIFGYGPNTTAMTSGPKDVTSSVRMYPTSVEDSEHGICVSLENNDYTAACFFASNKMRENSSNPEYRVQVNGRSATINESIAHQYRDETVGALLWNLLESGAQSYCDEGRPGRDKQLTCKALQLQLNMASEDIDARCRVLENSPGEGPQCGASVKLLCQRAGQTIQGFVGPNELASVQGWSVGDEVKFVGHLYSEPCGTSGEPIGLGDNCLELKTPFYNLSGLEVDQQEGCANGICLAQASCPATGEDSEQRIYDLTVACSCATLDGMDASSSEAITTCANSQFPVVASSGGDASLIRPGSEVVVPGESTEER